MNLEFPFTDGATIITVVNPPGQTMLKQNVTGVEDAVQINIQNLSGALYFNTVQNGEHTFGSRVHIIGSTYELEKSKFSCMHRGKIQAKNKGEFDMPACRSAKAGVRVGRYFVSRSLGEG